VLPLDIALGVVLLAPTIGVISVCLVHRGALRRRAPFAVLFFPGIRAGFAVGAPVWGGLLAVVAALIGSAYTCWTRGAAGATFVVTILATALSVFAAPAGPESPGGRATDHVPVALVGTLVLYGALIEELLIRWVPGAVYLALTEDVVPMVIYVPATAILFGVWHVHTQGWKAVPWKLALGLAWGWLAWSFGVGASYVSHLAYNSVALMRTDERLRPASPAPELDPGPTGPRRNRIGG
jgi:hypothetical protein